LYTLLQERVILGAGKTDLGENIVNMKKALICVALATMVVLSGAWATPTDVPRILLTGDSWPAFMQLFRCFEVRLGESGLTGIGQRGNQTTLVGVHADEFNTSFFLDKIRADLANYPTIDIVHLSLGGNDFISESHWTPSMPQEQVDAFIATVNAQVETVIDAILAVRPNIKVMLCGYDYAHHSMGGGTDLQVNTMWAAYEHTKMEMAARKDRVFYVHALGLMHHYYGIPDAGIAPLTLPMPSGHDADFTPWPGGNPNYFTPLEALMDKDIHLTLQGYDYLAQLCIDEYYAEWLSWPAVTEVVADPGKAPVQTFRVTFNKAVSGVNVADFQVQGVPGASVDSVEGSGSVYTVLVNLNGGSGTAQLIVLDDDTITDGVNPLGGLGAGNGEFAHNGPLTYTDAPLEGASDFTGAMEAMNDTFTPVAWMLGGQSFAPSMCDANGGSISVNPPGIVGNSMLDDYELGLVTKCLEDATLDFTATGGVSHSIVETAWLQNQARMLSDLGGVNGRILKGIPGLDTLLAGFMTLGDSDSTAVPVLLLTAVGFVIELPSGVTTPMPMNYAMLGDYFGPAGDADGDGVSNRREYEYYASLGGKALYVQAALDPEMAPPEVCENSEGGTYYERDSFCLTIPGMINLTGGFQWFKDGVALEDSETVSGSNARELHISSLAADDAGNYTCVYDNGTKSFGPVDLVVRDVQVPATDPAGIVLAMLAVGLLGAWLLKRARIA
jgi:hypothetical protein